MIALEVLKRERLKVAMTKEEIASMNRTTKRLKELMRRWHEIQEREKKKH